MTGFRAYKPTVLIWCSYKCVQTQTQRNITSRRRNTHMRHNTTQTNRHKTYAHTLPTWLSECVCCYAAAHECVYVWLSVFLICKRERGRPCVCHPPSPVGRVAADDIIMIVCVQARAQSACVVIPLAFAYHAHMCLYNIIWYDTIITLGECRDRERDLQWFACAPTTTQPTLYFIANHKGFIIRAHICIIRLCEQQLAADGDWRGWYHNRMVVLKWM